MKTQFLSRRSDAVSESDPHLGDTQLPNLWTHQRRSAVSNALGRPPEAVRPDRKKKPVQIPHIPEFPRGNSIPHVIHQTFPTRTLPSSIAKNIENIKHINPDWEHRLYDDKDVERFIEENYGSKVLKLYNKISSKYMAAKIDLFRYLLIYKNGGVYLDSKSTVTKPLNDVMHDDDRYILARWHNEPGERHAGFGKPRELQHVPGGEFQQWHIIATAGHPYLLEVIKEVLANIADYRPWHHGVGQRGTLRVTGSTPYTMAIKTIQRNNPSEASRSRVVDTDEFGLEYSVLENGGHKKLFERHYIGQTDPIVKQTGLNRLKSKIYPLPTEQKKQTPPAVRSHRLQKPGPSRGPVPA